MLNIIICSYNRPEFLMQTLQMLSTQQCNVIVSDDGSWPFPLRELSYGLKKFLWTRHDGYHRVARYNEAIEYLTEPYTVLLDDDCIPQSKGYVEAFVTDLKAYPVVRGLFKTEHGLDIAPWFSTTNLGIRTSILREIGGFDWAFDGKYGDEDLDMGIQLERKGYHWVKGSQHTACEHVGQPYSGDRSGNETNRKYLHQKWGLP